MVSVVEVFQVGGHRVGGDQSKACACQNCVNLCWHSPGWFGSKEEILGAAAVLGLDVGTFLKNWCIGEWIAGKDESILIPAPRKDFTKRTPASYSFPESLYLDESERNGPGFVKASWGHNLMTGFACIFLTADNRCQIHMSKPRECREEFGCRPNPQQSPRALAYTYWKDQQEWLRAQLGRECLIDEGVHA